MVTLASTSRKDPRTAETMRIEGCGKTVGTVRGLSFKVVTLRRCCGNSAGRLRKHRGHNAEHGRSRCGRYVGVHSWATIVPRLIPRFREFDSSLGTRERFLKWQNLGNCTEALGIKCHYLGNYSHPLVKMRVGSHIKVARLSNNYVIVNKGLTMTRYR